jgi:ADP-ribose pyrophosphatase YjhB (NUDIX family)
MGRLDGWRHCPRCAAPVVHAPGRVDCAACGFTAWANAAPTASALVEDAQGRLLLGRRAIEPFRGFWDTPGGFLQEDEHPLAALVREVREETGLDVAPGAYAGCWLDTYGEPGEEGVLFTLNLFWRVHVLPGPGGAAAPDPVAADDIAELAWFAPDALPPREQLAFTCVPLALEAWRAQGPGLPGPRRTI